MGLENFRPHWKPVEDKSLAHDMAKASDSYRTEAKKQKRIAQNYSKKRTVMDRILGISQKYQNEVAKRHTEDAGEESKTADFNEDMVEIENFAGHIPARRGKRQVNRRTKNKKHSLGVFFVLIFDTIKIMPTPFYDPAKTYEENFKEGPFGVFADGEVFSGHSVSTSKEYDFFGVKVNSPFGIPAGPL